MAEINRIADPVRPPQPVGGSFHKKPIRKRNEDRFEDILEKKKGEADEETEGEENSPAGSEDNDRPVKPERGRLVDELA
ncbi:MAG: hypothetical protein GY835_20110 [bacterium]|nr:hypothetical protein [bacterium]